MTWQPPDVIFPDAETLLTGAYRDLLTDYGETDVEVDRKVPKDRPDRLVAITRDGGRSAGLVDQPRVRFRIFGRDDADANDLAALVVALTSRLKRDGVVDHYEVQSGPYDVPDDSKRPQRYALIEFRIRGTALA